jgi:hypothetical protein
MNKALRTAFLWFLLGLTPVLFAGGGKEKSGRARQAEKQNTVLVTGRVRLVGNEPFSMLVISGPDNEWYIERNEENKLADLQHRTVSVEGDEIVETLKFANGLDAGERRILKNIKIITVE